MTRQFSQIPSAFVNTSIMDSHRTPLASQDPNSYVAGAGDVSAAPPWKQTRAVGVPGPLAGTGTSSSGGGGTYPEPGLGRHSTSTYTDSAAVQVPAQQSQPYSGHHRNRSRTRAGPHRRPHRNYIASGTTLRYSHDQTYNIHDRTSGWQPHLPDETTWVDECEDRMRREAERLAGIINQAR